MSDVQSLTQAVELVAAGSWAIETAARCLAKDDAERAARVLEDARATIRDGLDGLRGVLDATVRAEFDRPERLARAIASLQELHDFQLEPAARDPR